MATDKTVNELIVNKLTQAQFDAIPEAERSDTELYFITDANEDDAAYLPLSGGELTGPINIYQENTNGQKRSIFSTRVKPTDTPANGNLFEIKQNQSFVYVPGFKATGNIAPDTDESIDFGNASYHFRNVFTKYINAGRNNGANYATDLYNITVPAKKGTMALLEDIPEGTQLKTLPAASADNLNKIYQYTGETTSDYVNGHFYKSTNGIVQDWFTTGYAQYDTSLTLIVTVDKEKFLAQNPVWQDTGAKTWRADYDESTSEWYVWTQQPNIYISNADLKEVWGIDVTNAAGDYVPANGDTLMINLTESESFLWQQIDVQPNTNTNIPAHPTTPGAYTLMCYVDENGSASYAWENVA